MAKQNEISKTLRQYNKGLISAYEAYCVLMNSPDRGLISETMIIVALIGWN